VKRYTKVNINSFNRKPYTTIITVKMNINLAVIKW